MEQGTGADAPPAVTDIVVALTPQLLSDAVRRVLELDGQPTVEAIVGDLRTYGIAVVSPGREQQVRAATVVTLADDGLAPLPGTVHDVAQLRRRLAELRTPDHPLVDRPG